MCEEMLIIIDLPPELIVSIVAHLSIVDICRFRRCSRHIDQLIAANSNRLPQTPIQLVIDVVNYTMKWRRNWSNDDYQWYLDKSNETMNDIVICKFATNEPKQLTVEAESEDVREDSKRYLIDESSIMSMIEYLRRRQLFISSIRFGCYQNEEYIDGEVFTNIISWSMRRYCRFAVHRSRSTTHIR